MANTITYDPALPDQPEFTPEEQANIAIGEAQQQAEEGLLAGKFKDAEALEKAYVELQSKLGQQEATETPPPDPQTPEEVPEVPEVSPQQSLISEASAEWYENGEVTAETMQKFAEMDSSDLVKAYIEMQGQAQQETASADLTDADVATIKNDVGGEEAYGQLVQWAGQNLDQNLLDGFNSLLDSGNPAAIRLAVAGLKSEYDNNVGYEGRMLTGKNAAPEEAGFRSQAEVVAAMKDPRYNNDPAYRQDVFQKLERSNIPY